MSISAVDAMTCLFRFLGLAAVAAAAWNDLRDRIIPNRLVLLTLVLGLGALGPQGLPAAGQALLVAAGLLVALFFLSAFGALGGGDAKLMPAAVLLLPPQHIPQFLYWTAIWGGALGVLFLALRLSRLGAEASGGVRRWVHTQVSDDLPFGVAIAAGLATSLGLMA